MQKINRCYNLTTDLKIEVKNVTKPIQMETF